MKLADIKRDGRAFRTGMPYRNKRATKTNSSIVVVKANNKRDEITYISTTARNVPKTVTVEKFGLLVDQTFGGWEVDLKEAEMEAFQKRVAHERQNTIDAARDEADAFESLVDTLVASGAFATREDVYEITVHSSSRAFSRGAKEGEAIGREAGYDDGYSDGRNEYGYEY